MLISRKHKFIYVHIYKNAGTSITTALKPYAQNKILRGANHLLKRRNLPTLFFDCQPMQGHANASEIKKELGDEIFDSYFTFAFVRNPWDWQVSLYNFVRSKPAHKNHEFVKELGSFEEFVKWRCRKKVRFQKDFIYSDSGKLLVDFIGRFENLEIDFQKICDQLNISVSLPKLNASNRRPYQYYYNRNTKELIREHFKPDIELFKYEFE